MITQEALDLVLVPRGTWTLGVAEPKRGELPTRVVELEAFRVARAPVTNAEYRRYLKASGNAPPPFIEDEALNADGLPVVGISWFDAQSYLDWLRTQTGESLRLPSQDEREVAARAGRVACSWPWGEEAPELRPELAVIAGLKRPHAPGPACANDWGLSCMADNVHEWCCDALPGRAGRVERRMSCGGSWRHLVKFTSVAARSSLPPKLRYADYGFRVFAEA